MAEDMIKVEITRPIGASQLETESLGFNKGSKAYGTKGELLMYGRCEDIFRMNDKVAVTARGDFRQTDGGPYVGTVLKNQNVGDYCFILLEEHFGSSAPFAKTVSMRIDKPSAPLLSVDDDE